MSSPERSSRSIQEAAEHEERRPEERHHDEGEPALFHGIGSRDARSMGWVNDGSRMERM